MHVEGRRRNIGLTEHHMHLAAMMRLVIEEMEDSVRRGTRRVLAQAVGIAEWPGDKAVVQVREEGLNAGILLATRRAEFRESLEQDSVQWRCRTASAGEP